MYFHNVKAFLDNCSGPYRSIFSVLISLPFFFQKIVGVGLPLGGAHSRRAVSPLATPTLDGSSRNFSRKTAKYKVGGKEFDKHRFDKHHKTRLDQQILGT